MGNGNATEKDFSRADFENVRENVSKVASWAGNQKELTGDLAGKFDPVVVDGLQCGEDSHDKLTIQIFSDRDVLLNLYDDDAKVNARMIIPLKDLKRGLAEAVAKEKGRHTRNKQIETAARQATANVLNQIGKENDALNKMVRPFFPR